MVKSVNRTLTEQYHTTVEHAVYCLSLTKILLFDSLWCIVRLYHYYVVDTYSPGAKGPKWRFFDHDSEQAEFGLKL